MYLGTLKTSLNSVIIEKNIEYCQMYAERFFASVYEAKWQRLMIQACLVCFAVDTLECSYGAAKHMAVWFYDVTRDMALGGKECYAVRRKNVHTFAQ